MIRNLGECNCLCTRNYTGLIVLKVIRPILRGSPFTYREIYPKCFFETLGSFYLGFRSFHTGTKFNWRVIARESPVTMPGASGHPLAIYSRAMPAGAHIDNLTSSDLGLACSLGLLWAAYIWASQV